MLVEITMRTVCGGEIAEIVHEESHRIPLGTMQTTQNLIVLSSLVDILRLLQCDHLRTQCVWTCQMTHPPTSQIGIGMGLVN